MKKIFTLIMFGYIGLFANVELLDPAEEEMFRALVLLQWKTEISEPDELLVISALASSTDRIAEIAVRVAIIHGRIDVLKEAHEAGIKPPVGFSWILANVVIRGVDEGLEPLEVFQEELLSEKVREAVYAYILERRDGSVQEGNRQQELLQELLERDLESVYVNIMKRAGHLAAVTAARDLRQGRLPEVNLDHFPLTSFDQKLLHYSSHSSEKAQEEIIQRLAHATIAGDDEYELLRVLNSYEDVSLDSILTAFGENETERYGRRLLLEVIERRAVVGMTNSEMEKAKSVLDQYQTDDVQLERAMERVKNRFEKNRPGEIEY